LAATAAASAAVAPLPELLEPPLLPDELPELSPGELPDPPEEPLPKKLPKPPEKGSWELDPLPEPLGSEDPDPEAPVPLDEELPLLPAAVLAELDGAHSCPTATPAAAPPTTRAAVSIRGRVRRRRLGG
jgi:hypothetical protein